MRTFLIILSIIIVILIIVGVRMSRVKPKEFKLWIKPLKGRITSKYGTRIHPTLKVPKFHNGIDIAAPNGTPIKAPQDGTVIAVWEDNLNGLAIKIKHTNEWTTGYAHLSSQSVNKDQKVKQGDVIGAVGSTGRSTGNHLHLTLRDDMNKYSDPEKSIYV